MKMWKDASFVPCSQLIKGNPCKANPFCLTMYKAFVEASSQGCHRKNENQAFSKDRKTLKRPCQRIGIPYGLVSKKGLLGAQSAPLGALGNAQEQALT